MITIYHNNRCSKSREGLRLLQNLGEDFKIINYLTDVPGKTELKKIVALLNIKPIDLIRKNEMVWKEHYKNLELTDNQVIEAMLKYPKLIERPIVISGDKAVIGRPPNKILEII